MDNVRREGIKAPGFFTKLLEASRMDADPSSMTSATPSLRREDLGKHGHQSSHVLCLCGSNKKKQGKNHSDSQVTTTSDSSFKSEEWPKYSRCRISC